MNTRTRAHQLRCSQQLCVALFSRDYYISTLNNELMQWCPTYPLKIIIIENERTGPFKVVHLSLSIFLLLSVSLYLFRSVCVSLYLYIYISLCFTVSLSFLCVFAAVSLFLFVCVSLRLSLRISLLLMY